MKVEEKIEFKNREGQKIVGLLKKEGDTAIIICHGFKGSMHRPRNEMLVKKLPYTTLRFDFSDGLGESDGKMEDITVGHYVGDLISAVDYLKGIGIKKIGVVGHSLGGMVALMAASKDKRINCVVGLAGVFDFDLLRTLSNEEAKLTIETWKERGYAMFHSDSFNVDCRVNYEFYEEGIKYDMEKIVGDITVPVFVIIAENDEAVPRAHGLNIYKFAHEPKKMEVVKGANHGFHGKENIVADLCLQWFDENLR